MEKLLNTLYITRQESCLHNERETIVIKNGDDKLAQFAALTVGNILCFGQISVSPFLMGFCAAPGLRASRVRGLKFVVVILIAVVELFIERRRNC